MLARSVQTSYKLGRTSGEARKGIEMAKRKRISPGKAFGVGVTQAIEVVTGRKTLPHAAKDVERNLERAKNKKPTKGK